jgi:hypothetical protein
MKLISITFYGYHLDTIVYSRVLGFILIYLVLMIISFIFFSYV